MKWEEIKNIPFRVKMLATRRFVWVDQETGEERVAKESWKTAWTLVGIHSYRWWWIGKYGKLQCGCTRNPLTRRMVSYVWRCPEHMAWINDIDLEESS